MWCHSDGTSAKPAHQSHCHHLQLQHFSASRQCNRLQLRDVSRRLSQLHKEWNKAWWVNLKVYSLFAPIFHQGIMSSEMFQISSLNKPWERSTCYLMIPVHQKPIPWSWCNKVWNENITKRNKEKQTISSSLLINWEKWFINSLSIFLSIRELPKIP